MRTAHTQNYSQARGKEPIDWYNELTQPSISQHRWRKLKPLAREWVTCACGNLCDVIPRDHSGMPIDLTLAKLGTQFNANIIRENKEMALETLDQIEIRSQEIIDEINASNNTWYILSQNK